METTFISIHDLTENATLLYSSDSVIDILGYTPEAIVNRSAWDFFAVEDVPYARNFHQKRVASDKAAVLVYCRIKDINGDWVGCECCFTIVYDVMVVCTSIYKRNLSSENRAATAPLVRRIFSSSPADPRYHMLSHLSAKFSQPFSDHQHEPRAALFLNRFTRTLTIMYATSGLEEVLGIPAETMRGRSFYYCISENCLQDAIKCLENARSNNSIAYLRFWFRDPRIDDEPSPGSEGSDEEMSTDTSDDEVARPPRHHPSPGASMDVDSDESKTDSRHSSNESTQEPDTHEAIFGQARVPESSASSLDISPDREKSQSGMREPDRIELEAVISCASDGLVVCLRKARPMIPHPTQPPSRPVYQNGMFVAPWAKESILPSMNTRAGTGFRSTFAPALSPQGAQRSSYGTAAMPGAGPDQSDFMNAIRDQAIFAWALTGINGSLNRFGSGTPTGESIPADGLKVWRNDDKHSQEDTYITCGQSGHDLPFDAAAPSHYKPKPAPHPFGDPGLGRNGISGSRSLHLDGDGNGVGGAGGKTFKSEPD